MQTKLFQSGAGTGRKRGLCHSLAYLLALSILLLILIPQAAAQSWQLAWSDEFNGPAGSAPSSADWSFMLGENNANGEQEIMEWVPHYTPTTTSSTIHGPGYSGANGIGSRFTFPNGGRIDDAAYHTYGVIWSQDKMEFYRDDWTKPFFTVTSSNIPAGTQWVFNHPFYILFNFDIGGGVPVPPAASSPTPAGVFVDYVRVYQPCTSCTQTVAVNAGGPAVPPFDADRDFTGGVSV